MILSCPACLQQMQIEDSKVPEGTFKVRCSRCGKIVTAEGKRDDLKEEVPGAIREYLKNELSALRDELEHRDSKPIATGQSDVQVTPDVLRALVCEADSAQAENIATILKKMGYLVEVTNLTADAIKKIEAQQYQVITADYQMADDKEGGRKIIGRINSQKPQQRRGIFLILISGQTKTLDINSAFFYGANIAVNMAELSKLPTLISEGLQQFQHVYRLFNRILTERDRQI